MKVDLAYWLFQASGWLLGFAMLVFGLIVRTWLLRRRRRNEEALREVQRTWFRARREERAELEREAGAHYPLIIETLPDGSKRVLSYLGEAGEVRRFPPNGFDGLD